jgi:hypothetical protein
MARVPDAHLQVIVEETTLQICCTGEERKKQQQRLRQRQLPHLTSTPIATKA